MSRLAGWYSGIVISILILLAGTARVHADPPGTEKMVVYQTPYYVMHTDLDPAMAREAALRMTRMAEEYHRRLSGFSGEIQTRLPFYLFKNLNDYYAAGAIPNTAGVFVGNALLAYAGEKPNAVTWHTIQHEGFHQFEMSMMRGDIPVWLNEGLAEYFGEALFTGDGFVTGVIPPLRLRQVRAQFQLAAADGGFRPVQEMMLLPHAQWNKEMNGQNYDQAWSMVQFLAHGDDGKYQPAFAALLMEIGRGKDWASAWRDQFGSAVGFESDWREWWLKLPANPNGELYTSADVQTLTSFLARANKMHQHFATFDDFAAAVKDGTIKIPDDNGWLPIALGQKWMRTAQTWRNEGAQFSLNFAVVRTGYGEHQSDTPSGITALMPDGARLTSSYIWGTEDHPTVTVDTIAADHLYRPGGDLR